LSRIIEEFRAGLGRGELLIQHCNSCGRLNLYPRHRCPFCHENDLGWQAAAGDGVLHSFTVVRAVAPRGFEDDLPYGLGVVKLAEGVQLLARLHPGPGGTWARYACDARVTFEPVPPASIEQRPVAWFQLAD
jgi:uncharacterized OB-fold protein